MTRPSVYLASKLHRHSMWREWKAELSPSTINITSTWHNHPDVEILELDATECANGWVLNRFQILRETTHLIAFATEGDKLNGTLVEIGLALATGCTIHLVGDYAWGTWRFLDNIHLHDTLHEALCAITGTEHHLPIKEHLLNDPN